MFKKGHKRLPKSHSFQKGEHASSRTEFKKGHTISRETKRKMSLTHKQIGTKPPINPRYGKDNNFWKGGITLSRQEYQLKKQKKLAGRDKPQRCEVCNFRGRICFDHCHKTGKFRGWICILCNLVLGAVRDDPEILKKLIVYLEKNQ